MSEKVATTSTAVTYAASVATVISGLTLTDWGVIAGISIGILTYVTNWFLRRKEVAANVAAKKLEMEEISLRIERERLELEGVKMRKEPRGSTP
jgi:uncharacterized alkaline shock family protein YloU